MVENKVGANGEMAASFTAKRPPDGSVFTLASNGSTTVAPALSRNMPYYIRTDFVAVALVGIDPMLLVVRPDLQVKTVAELLDLARIKGDDLARRRTRPLQGRRSCDGRSHGEPDRSSFRRAVDGGHT